MAVRWRCISLRRCSLHASNRPCSSMKRRAEISTLSTSMAHEEKGVSRELVDPLSSCMKKGSSSKGLEQWVVVDRFAPGSRLSTHDEGHAGQKKCRHDRGRPRPTRRRRRRGSLLLVQTLAEAPQLLGHERCRCCTIFARGAGAHRTATTPIRMAPTISVRVVTGSPPGSRGRSSSRRNTRSSNERGEWSDIFLGRCLQKKCPWT